MRYALLFLSLLYVCGCRPAAKDQEVKPVVAVSILPLQYVVEGLSGGDFEAISIVPPGTNPEIYEPTAAQMKAVSDAELFLQIGLLDFEWALSTGMKDYTPDLEVVDLSDGLLLIEGDHGHVPSEDPKIRSGRWRSIPTCGSPLPGCGRWSGGSRKNCRPCVRIRPGSTKGTGMP